MYVVHLYGLHVYYALVDLGSSRSPGVRPTPGLASSSQVVCVCVRAYTSTRDAYMSRAVFIRMYLTILYMTHLCVTHVACDKPHLYD